MSSPLAIGAVSAVLRNLLDNGLIQTGPVGSPVHVSAVAPDTIDLEAAGERRLNLFLYKVTPNAGWRNHALPSRGSANGERLTNPPLALDLHYMLTAYSRVDCEAEILLGYGMHLLHERPVLDRPAIRRALNPSPLNVSMLPASFQALAASDLADQVEQIKIIHTAFDGDDMSKLWSAIQSHYRPSAAYQVSVVLIEATQPAISPLPVLSRGEVDAATHRDRGVVVNPDVLPPLPTLFAAEPPPGQIAARVGETVTLTGVRLAGTGHVVRLGHALLPVPLEIAPTAVAADGTSLTFPLAGALPAPGEFIAGQLSASVRFKPPGKPIAIDTNSVPLVIAPVPDLAAAATTAIRDATSGEVTVTLQSSPPVRPRQNATLVLGGVEASAKPRALETDPLVFVFPASLANDTYWVRLRIDGTESLLIDRSGPAPAFDTSQKLQVPKP
jgi:hypothetical protein